jgi:4-hydroxy-tetrahydrodipicolinate synthase
MAGGSNVWPRLFVALYEAAAAGDLHRVAALQQRAMQFDRAVYRSANPLRGMKCALSLLGICGGDLTSPLQPYSQQERDVVKKYLQTVDVLKDPV